MPPPRPVNQQKETIYVAFGPLRVNQRNFNFGNKIAKWLINQLSRKNGQQQIHYIGLFINNNFAIFQVQNSFIAQQLAQLTGILYFQQELFVSQCSNLGHPIELQVDQFVAANYSTKDAMFPNEETIDLTNIASKLSKNLNVLNLHDPYVFNSIGTISFLFFYVAMLLDEEGTRTNVKTINFTNNHLTNSDELKGITKLFPNIDNFLIDANIDHPPELSARGYGVYEIVQRDQIQESYPPVQLEYPTITLDNFQSTVIRPFDFPTNKFILSYFDAFQNDFESLTMFYCQSAIFSMATEDSNDESLEYYHQFGRNLLSNAENITSGPEGIVESHKLIFESPPTIKITHLQNNNAAKSIYSIVVHGVFIDITETILGFDRSFVIGEDSGAFFITNDHLFIHTI